MKNTTHRVVILNNVNSALISQAILILKDGTSDCETNVLEEAERIVERYMKNKSAIPSPAKPHTKLLYLLSAAVALTGVCLFLLTHFL
ncbi:MAG: hypothetical protein PUE13_03720 [Clostridiales bacterium]|nr:hypothetical protein [Clostridiales bacterium]